jgi:glycosyltransferase involved in cell wall biosynthesis
MYERTSPPPGARVKVLLFSPLRGYDPLSGDTSYTDSLLEDPPPGVHYVSYRQAIDDGTLRIRGRKPWHGGWSPLDILLFSVRTVEMLLRRIGIMFRESVEFVSIAPGAFDLMHQHLFAVRQVGGARIPVVSSAGYPLTELYRFREGWSSRHLRVALALEAAYARMARIHNPWLRGVRSGVMTVSTETFRDWLVGRGADRDRVLLAGTALPEASLQPSRSDQRTLGVIARDFHRKGGDIALEAFHLLSAREAGWRLIIATTRRNAAAIPSHPSIEVLVDIDRQHVLTDVLPRIDIMLAPTRSDCGVPYGVLEALRAGVCVVASDDRWLDSRLAGPGVRRTPLTPSSVADAVSDIARSGLSGERVAAAGLFRREFRMAGLHDALVGAYDIALPTHAPMSKIPTVARRRLLVVCRDLDMVESRFDGFILRHRRMVRELARDYDVEMLVIRNSKRDGSVPVVDGVGHVRLVSMAPRPVARSARLCAVALAMLGRESSAEATLAAAAEEGCPDFVLTIGPWLGIEYRPLWRRFPAVHLFEEDLTQMVEVASQSRQARALRAVERRGYALTSAQPDTVVSISRPEVSRARAIYPRSNHTLLPFTLDPASWPEFQTGSIGTSVLAVGNFAEDRNAEGLAALFEELSSRPGRRLSEKVKIVSGPGVHDILVPFSDQFLVCSAESPEELVDRYRCALAAVVPSRRMTGIKTTVLQAWSCGVPVVCSAEAARSIGSTSGLLVGRSPSEMADHLLRIETDRVLRERLVAAGYQTLRADFDASQEVVVLSALLSSALRRPTRRRR